MPNTLLLPIGFKLPLDIRMKGRIEDDGSYYDILSPSEDGGYVFPDPSVTLIEFAAPGTDPNDYEVRFYGYKVGTDLTRLVEVSVVTLEKYDDFTVPATAVSTTVGGGGGGGAATPMAHSKFRVAVKLTVGDNTDIVVNLCKKSGAKRLVKCSRNLVKFV